VALERGAHRVQAVLAEKKHGELPETGQVQRLVELALGHRAVAEEAGRHPAALERVGEGEAHGDREAAADDRVAAVEAPGDVEEVHRAAPPPAAPVGLAVHLRHQRARRDAAGERVAVLAIGRDHRVLRGERPHRAHRHRLLAYIKVEESPDLPGAVSLRGLLLEAPDPEHLAQERVAVLAGGRRRGHRAPVSSVEVSPSGRPSSRAFRSRRMIFPLRVLGSAGCRS
jgi:hypothetical protein